ncbi:MAG: hypothetical protein COU25_03330 [Candidatus Levybacteria bacterium CG10_big_fil_rev_8_21_14_0_10_35_13]|nr:MAG: hypothetical protein COU25_03330 [Candidatus Levybacteria bacterium CG10_big_fil_rev_8_21_14_0_10_35_13]
MRNKIFLGLIIFYILNFIFYISEANAQTMTNDNYILQMGNLNSIAGKPTGGNYQLSFTSGESGQNLFSGPNYKVKAGFQYIHPLNTFSFTISNTSIDFGLISPTTPVTRTNNLTVTNESAYGYAVTVSQNHNLRVNSSGQEIPATTCDSGTCTTTTSDAWTSSLVYGFGYRCDNVSGTDCAGGFSDSTFYKQFAASPSAVTVMSSPNVGKNRQTQITYKVNVAVTQAAGLYTNIINYIATPSF